jgi:hypothetical protein
VLCDNKKLEINMPSKGRHCVNGRVYMNRVFPNFAAKCSPDQLFHNFVHGDDKEHPAPQRTSQPAPENIPSIFDSTVTKPNTPAANQNEPVNTTKPTNAKSLTEYTQCIGYMSTILFIVMIGFFIGHIELRDTVHIQMTKPKDMPDVFNITMAAYTTMFSVANRTAEHEMTALSDIIGQLCDLRHENNGYFCISGAHDKFMQDGQQKNIRTVGLAITQCLLKHYHPETLGTWRCNHLSNLILWAATVPLCTPLIFVYCFPTAPRLQFLFFTVVSSSLLVGFMLLLSKPMTMVMIPASFYAFLLAVMTAQVWNAFQNAKRSQIVPMKEDAAVNHIQFTMASYTSDLVLFFGPCIVVFLNCHT